MRLVNDDLWGVMTVYQEAASEPYAGKVAVAEVIRRRTALKYHSDGTIAGTVLSPLQFSGWNAKDPTRLIAAKIDDQMPTVQECLKAWYDSTTSELAKDAVLYYNPRIVTPGWNFDELEFVVTIGHHDFYREKKS